MASARSRPRLAPDLLRLCRAGLDARTLRTRALERLRREVPIECAWWATADPETLLFTDPLAEQIPEQAGPLFVANEFLSEDVNKFVGLANAADPVRTLSGATSGKPESSPRFRDILRPFGMGDELRVALREGGRCWGYMCLHRAAGGHDFTADETGVVREWGPHLAGALRTAFLLGRSAAAEEPGLPGVVVLHEDLSLISMTPAAAAWLDELEATPTQQLRALDGVVAQLLAIEHGKAVPAPPRARVRTRAGRLLTLYASRLANDPPENAIAVILEPSRAEDSVPIVLAAFELTEREQRVAHGVLRGMNNKILAKALGIAPLTVQQHLKSVFEKVGVHSRGELIGKVFAYGRTQRL